MSRHDLLLELRSSVHFTVSKSLVEAAVVHAEKQYVLKVAPDMFSTTSLLSGHSIQRVAT